MTLDWPRIAHLAQVLGLCGGLLGLAACGGGGTETKTETVADAAGSDGGGSETAGQDGSAADVAVADISDTTTAPDATGDGGPTPDSAGDAGVDVPVVEKKVGGAVGFAVNLLDKAAQLSANVYVTDDDGLAVADAEVAVNGKIFAVSGTTAKLTGVSVSASPTITVRAKGYASAALLLDPLRAMNGVSVVLRKFAGSKTFPSALGGTLQVPAASITLESDGVVGPGGVAYAGAVQVAAVTTQLSDLMDPVGGISAKAAAKLPDPVVMVASADGSAKTASLKLASLHVSLTGAAGQELQPAPGKPAIVDFALDGAIALAFPGAYTAGAKLDVASRNETTGAWSVSGQCTVAKGASGWSCKAALPHFSEAAVTKPESQGCLVVGSLDLTVAEGETVTWRRQRLAFGEGEARQEVTGHVYDNGGKLGLCAIVPMNVESIRLEVQYQTGKAGTQVTAEPNDADGLSMYTLRKFLGKPSDQKLSAVKNLDTTSAAGCLAACGAAPKQEVVMPYVAPSPPPDPTKFVEVPPPAPAPMYDAVDFSKVDLDKDGAPATTDCDDGNPNRAPGKADPCGDGIDQNCDGKDTLCPIVCSQALIKCAAPCLGKEASPKTPKDVACIGTCQISEPFLTAAEGQAWTDLQKCITTCGTPDCVDAKCVNLIGACMGAGPWTCATAAPCQLGCTAMAGVTAAYEACLSSCPPELEPAVAKAVEDLVSCGKASCGTSLAKCSASPAQAVGFCSQNDLACYANLPACASAYAACFNP